MPVDDNIITKILLDMQKQIGENSRQTAETHAITKQILDQTKRTNGAVLNLQSRMAAVESTQAACQGAGRLRDKVTDKAEGRRWDVAKMFLTGGISAIMGSAIGALAVLLAGAK